MKLKQFLVSILCVATVLTTMGAVALAKGNTDVWDGTVDISWYDASEDEFTITTAEQFAGLAYLVNGVQTLSPAGNTEGAPVIGYYTDGNKKYEPKTGETYADKSISFDGKIIKLDANLDMRAKDENGEIIRLPGNEYLTMMPVGFSSYTPFKGTFDGQGHTIKNIFQGMWDAIGWPSDNYALYVSFGVFGNVENATIMNLTVDNISFNSECRVGGVIGKAGGVSTFENITLKNSVVTSGGGWQIGGLIGNAYGDLTINKVKIGESNTVGASGGNFDASVGGIIGKCTDEGCNSITITNSTVACKLDVFNDCTASYDTNSYRNCGMVIGGVGENNELTIDGKLYPDFEAKNFEFKDVKVTIGEWASYTYCWSYSLKNNCQRIEPGINYKGIDVSKIADASVDTSRPFDAIFGAENAGNLENVRGAVNARGLEFLEVEGIIVTDKAYLERTAVELYIPDTTARAAQLIFVDTFASLDDAIEFIGDEEGEYILKVIKDIDEDVVITQSANQTITITGDEEAAPVITGTITVGGEATSGDAIVIDIAINGNLTINGGAVKIISGGVTGDLDVANVAKVAISGGIFSEDVNDYAADGMESVRTSDGYTVAPKKLQANTISVEFKDVTATDAEGEKIYEVYVKANDDDNINELASLDLTFVYTATPVNGGAIDFTVAPMTNFAMTRKDDTDRYMFNYNGVTAFEGTAKAIAFATITVTGYGEYTIATELADTNIVNATTVNDNLVDSYTAAGAKDDDDTTGGLIINKDTVETDDLFGTVGGKIAVPTRKLTINITFPNAVNPNEAEYQDMKVEITGNIDGETKTVTYDLGTNMTNGAYVVTENKLVLNNAYTVTVSGAGYRTARYTVTMTDDKTLNFWNNVKDNAFEVEVGKSSSAKEITFLAGDIVKDSVINIYDLSAVVSYFGETGLVGNNNAYAKYDLNRDGKIDSKDVAYVLVSWAN